MNFLNQHHIKETIVCGWRGHFRNKTTTMFFLLATGSSLEFILKSWMSWRVKRGHEGSPLMRRSRIGHGENTWYNFVHMHIHTRTPVHTPTSPHRSTGHYPDTLTTLRSLFDFCALLTGGQWPTRLGCVSCVYHQCSHGSNIFSTINVQWFLKLRSKYTIPTPYKSYPILNKCDKTILSYFVFLTQLKTSVIISSNKFFWFFFSITNQSVKFQY